MFYACIDHCFREGLSVITAGTLIAIPTLEASFLLLFSALLIAFCIMKTCSHMGISVTDWTSVWFCIFKYSWLTIKTCKLIQNRFLRYSEAYNNTRL